jgi:glutamate 5-kinase
VSAQADLLIILSDVDGLYSSDPRKDSNATLIQYVHGISEEIFALAGNVGSPLGTGGMKTKLKAAKICMEQGVDTVIANGSKPELLYDIVEGKRGRYTRFFAKD